MRKLICFILLISAGLAQFDWVSQQVTIDLNKAGIANMQMSIRVYNTSEEVNEIVVPLISSDARPTNIQFTGGLQHRIEEREGITSLIVSIPSPTQALLNFTVSFSADFVSAGLIENKSKGYSIVYMMPSFSNNTFTKLSLRLPQNATPIEVQHGKSVIVNPEPIDSSVTWTDRMLLEWTWLLRDGESAIVLMKYSLPEEGDASNGSSEHSSTELQSAIAIGAACMLAVIAILALRRKSKRAEIIKDALTEDEKMVCDHITGKGGEALQDEMRRDLGFSKPKISKVLRNLEMKKAVTKTPWRKTNKVKLV